MVVIAYSNRSLLDSSSGLHTIESAVIFLDFLDTALGGKVGDHFLQERLLLTGRPIRQPVPHDPLKGIFRIRSSGQVGENLTRYL